MSAIDQAHRLIKEQNTHGDLFSQISPYDPDLVINTAFFNTGNVKFRFTIKAGRLHGIGRIYYENAQLMEELPFHKGVLHGASRSWYENGQIKQESIFVNNQLNGLRRCWYPSSQLQSEYSYKDNQPDGDFLQWFQNGAVKEKGSYLAGKRHGIFKEIDESGELIRKELFVKGVSYSGKLKRLIDSKKFNCKRLAKIKSQAVRRILLEELGYESTD